MKKLTFTRTSSIRIEKLSPGEIDGLFSIHHGKRIDQRKAKASRDFFRSATFLTYQQYIDLVHKRPYLSDQLQFLRLSGEKTIEGLIIITDNKVIISPFNVLHTYINNCNLIKTFQLVKGDYFFFDQNIAFSFNGFLYTHLYLKPDGIILKNNDQIIFIETDMGTETKKRLQLKSAYYREIVGGRNARGFEGFKIIFFTTTKKRLGHLRHNNIFGGLEALSLIEYGINNTK